MKERWEHAYEDGPKRRDRFTTLSFEPVPALGLREDGDVAEVLALEAEYLADIAAIGRPVEGPA